ncbi:MAG: hypothetical protein KDK36_00455, partial [Leptospiraceae bacterium]|nr:hypothetical protein [Leptospiraceae bacterium]
LLIHGTVEYLFDNINILVISTLSLALIVGFKNKQLNRIEIKPFLKLFYIIVTIILFLNQFHSQLKNKANSQLTKYQLINYNCPDFIVKINLTNSFNKIETLKYMEISKTFEKNKLINIYPDSRFDSLYGSYYHALYLKVPDRKYFQNSENFYKKCLKSHPFAKTCKILLDNLYEKDRRSLNRQNSELEGIINFSRNKYIAKKCNLEDFK